MKRTPVRPEPRRRDWLLATLAWGAGAGGAASAADAAADLPAVEFIIDLSAEISAGRFDPARDALGLRGAPSPMSWQRPVLADPIDAGRYRVVLPVPRPPFGGQALQYKFRRERPGQGPDEGWEPGRNHAFRLAGARIRIERAFGAEAQPLPPRRTGRIDALGVILSRHVMARPVQVWLPPGYRDDAGPRHPVLYLHDGQNVFDDAAAGAEWMVDETTDRLVRSGAIEPPIVVAIDSTRERITDYTPTRIRLPAERTGTGRAELVGGGAAAYGRFLAEELKPLIDARYRTRVGASDTAVGGSSLGGLVSLVLALELPQVFGAALVVSPSLWWDEGWPLRQILARPLHPPLAARVWLDMGANEGPGSLDAARQLHAALKERCPDRSRLAYVEDADGGHDEMSWAARVEGMMRFLYGRT